MFNLTRVLFFLVMTCMVLISVTTDLVFLCISTFRYSPYFSDYGYPLVHIFILICQRFLLDFSFVVKDSLA